MASHTLLTLCANRVSGRIAFIQRNPSFLMENAEARREVRVWSLQTIGFSCSYKVMRIQKNLFQAQQLGAHQENASQKRLRLTFTILRNSYIYVSNKDLSIIKSPLDNIMRGVIKGIGVQAKGSIYELSKIGKLPPRNGEEGIWN